MPIDILVAEERVVLAQLRWGAASDPRPEDEKICRRLEAQGLVVRVANGRWALTGAGGLTAAFGY